MSTLFLILTLFPFHGRPECFQERRWNKSAKIFVGWNKISKFKVKMEPRETPPIKN
jgi:hypothetical protein